MHIDARILDLIDDCEKGLSEKFCDIDRMVEYNQVRLLKSMKECKISDRHFISTTGYGYGDDGRDKLEELYATVFGCEDALVRPHWGSGTHVISDALYAVLRPGDNLLSITGRPYDTLGDTIGLNTSSGALDNGSLANWGITYSEIDLDLGGKINVLKALEAIGKTNTKVILLQRSRGYEWRPAIPVRDMIEPIKEIRKRYPDVFIIVDNCYGEFVEDIEPSHAGADLTVGSLIKNPGGGLAPTGAYAVGTKRAVELMSYRLTSPSVGREIGSYAASYLPFYQGLFLAPHIVGQSLKGAVLTSKVFETLGYKVTPKWEEERADIIQCIRLNNPEELISLCQAIQWTSPVDSHVTPFPWEMPGYNHEVIMAAGTFIQGASIELSADAPIKDPYTLYLQGGLTYAHVKYSLIYAISELYKLGHINQESLGSFI
ncbi:MAG: hypothetical protein GX352_03370 [Clostridiales bacterium]|nr:hypothetical protein [Clostridiales bacterium]